MLINENTILSAIKNIPSKKSKIKKDITFEKNKFKATLSRLLLRFLVAVKVQMMTLMKFLVTTLVDANVFWLTNTFINVIIWSFS